MAIITIYIEGGVLPHNNHNALTINNSEKLRESFYKLLTQKLDDNDFQLSVEIGSSNQQTINFFKSELNSNKDVYLFIDLDNPKHKKNELLKRYSLDNIPDRVFFMVQEMEAWILSQPHKIEDCYSHLKRKNSHIKIADDKSIAGKDIETISKPSKILHTLLGRYFRVEKKGVEKKKKYNKLSDGSNLLELLDFNALALTFEDVKKFSDKFSTNNSK